MNERAFLLFSEVELSSDDNDTFARRLNAVENSSPLAKAIFFSLPHSMGAGVHARVVVISLQRIIGCCRLAKPGRNKIPRVLCGAGIRPFYFLLPERRERALGASALNQHTMAGPIVSAAGANTPEPRTEPAFRHLAVLSRDLRPHACLKRGESRASRPNPPWPLFVLR